MNYLERIHLETLRAVETYGTMTAAAEALHLSQSALSHSMRKLEDQLGVELWHRDGRTLRPTQAGEHLLAAAKRMIPQFEHAEQSLLQFARGERGALRVGMECHPCYQWLQKISGPFLHAWPSVDLDVRQEFQFGGIGALFAYELDLLVTPDPLYKPGLHFEPVFDYEQVLVVGENHPLQNAKYARPKDLLSEVLLTYPISLDRLDIYTHFLTPAGMAPKRHKIVETTDIMLQLVGCGRGVAALPRWLVEEYAQKYPIHPVRLGPKGVPKKIHLGIRKTDETIDYVQAFIALARSYREISDTALTV